MTQRYLDIDFPLPFFDLEVSSDGSPDGFELRFGHLKEAFFTRQEDGSYVLRSLATSSDFTIRAVELLDDGQVRSLGDSGEEILLRIRPFEFPSDRY